MDICLLKAFMGSRMPCIFSIVMLQFDLHIDERVLLACNSVSKRNNQYIGYRLPTVS